MLEISLIVQPCLSPRLSLKPMYYTNAAITLWTPNSLGVVATSQWKEGQDLLYVQGQEGGVCERSLPPGIGSSETLCWSSHEAVTSTVREAK